MRPASPKKQSTYPNLQSPSFQNLIRFPNPTRPATVLASKKFFSVQPNIIWEYQEISIILFKRVRDMIEA
jgi:hypothetical protein